MDGNELGERMRESYVNGSGMTADSFIKTAITKGDLFPSCPHLCRFMQVYAAR